MFTLFIKVMLSTYSLSITEHIILFFILMFMLRLEIKSFKKGRKKFTLSEYIIRIYLFLEVDETIGPINKQSFGLYLVKLKINTIHC